jgi:hypothetical protein
MRQSPIRSLRVPLSDSFEEDMKRIREEREKLVQEISEKCITASDFTKICQDNVLSIKKKKDNKNNCQKE